MIAAGPTAVTSIEPWMTTPWEINFGERIGEGSLGPKYRGVLYGHMDKVVIEVLRDTSKRQQFLKTLQLWHMLDHSNVLPVLGGSVETARVFYVAPLMPAGTLRHYLARTRLGSEKRLQMLCEIALGVEYLHSHRVIHGCLNSSNVFVDDNGKPILTDFGFLDVRNSSDSDDVPEGAGSQAGDSWLFANIGYEMFSINPTSVHKHGAQKIIHPVARPADCPEKLWSLLQRCWEAELDQRPTFAMIVGELRDLMEISETATAALAAEIHAPTARKYSVNFGSPPPWLQVPSPSASLPSHPPPSRGASGLSILDDEEEIPESLSMEMERAIQGDPHAQNVIASYYERGVKGLTKNLTKAVRWYRKAADKGNAAAQCSLGRACEGGWGGLQKDLVQALKWFRKAAEQGNAFAEYRVGLSYEFGTRGLPKDLDMARNLFSKAADQGLADAQGRLGSWYEHGIGNLPNNLLLAAEWYRKSADGGGATGQYDLGRFYEHGLGGVPKDLKAALEWYDLSAQQGNHLAQSAIERLTQS
ncbi:kinase-like protein [Gonapodya prolifera JEL478]|uniref:Kinase-like protein n=1 Tax=Gonapodya prolifera (strain JEL478) TaxID=1344416 RepID=A0A139ANM5_GONPJ|nr:kinase-like protein [Gonapodya prolifera JEL478]|eukprot:KXS18328.1 kinase-like protein [Gonapodya prolifera JEL478]